MMKNKHTKKNTFYTLYAEEIHDLVLLCFVLLTVFIFDISFNNLDKIFEFLKMYGTTINNAFDNTLYLVMFIYVLYTMCNIIMFCINQLYIPFTKEELKQDGITSIEEYNDCLKNSLRGFTPDKRLQNLIMFEGFRNLISKEEQLKYVDCLNDETRKQNLMESMIDYQASYDIRKEDNFVNGFIESLQSEINSGFFDKFYFNKTKKSASTRAFLIVLISLNAFVIEVKMLSSIMNCILVIVTLFIIVGAYFSETSPDN